MGWRGSSLKVNRLNVVNSNKGMRKDLNILNFNKK
jgi:hypothetical protein